MKYRLTITGPAKEDIRQNHQWWAENRSEEQADRWLIGIDAVIRSLSEIAEGYSYASEPALKNQGIRQCNFGVSDHPTHRILYGIQEGVVIIYRIRSTRQDRMAVKDLKHQN